MSVSIRVPFVEFLFFFLECFMSGVPAVTGPHFLAAGGKNK